MASAYVTGLLARRDEIASELATLTREANQPGAKANISDAGGGMAVDHVGYKDGLYRELKEINDLLKDASNVDGALDGANDPFAIETTIVN